MRARSQLWQWELTVNASAVANTLPSSPVGRFPRRHLENPPIQRWSTSLRPNIMRKAELAIELMGGVVCGDFCVYP